MRRRHPLLVVLALATVAAAATVVGCFPLERAGTLLPGTVRGQARFSGAARSGVGVSLSNTRFTKNSDAGGDFLIAGLGAGTHGVRLQEDDDGDGVVDRGAAIAFSITNDAKDVVGVDLGPVALRGTVTVSGTVTAQDGVGLDGLVVVVSRFGLDKNAEVYVPLRDEDGDGVVEYSLRGVVPGAIEVQAFAAGGRASPARRIDLGDDSDESGIDLDVVDVDVVPVSTNVAPALSTARFAVVEVDAGPNAPAIAGDRVGRVVDLEAGVYDVWFFAGDEDDTTPIAVLPRQVARPFETPPVDDSPRALQWGPALRGAVSGIDGTENTLPTIESLVEQRVLVSSANGPQRLALTVADPDGDPVTITAVAPPSDIPISLQIDGTDVVVTYTGGADPGAALFSRTPILVEVDDGRGVAARQVGTAIIADGVFIGPGTDYDDVADPGANWLGRRLPPGLGANVVVESPLTSAGGLSFAALDLRSVLDIGVDELNVTRIFSSNGDGLVQGGGRVTLAGSEAAPGLFVGRAHGVSIRVEGVVELRELRAVAADDDVSGSSTLQLASGGVLRQSGASGGVFIEIPTVAEAGSTLRFTDGAVVRFTKNVQLAGTVDIDDSSGIALGDDELSSAITLFAPDTIELGTLSVAGTAGSVFQIDAPIRATRELRIAGAARVEARREQLEVGSLVMTAPAGSLAAPNIKVGLDVDGTAGTRVVNGRVESPLTVAGDVAIAGDLVVLTTDGDGVPDGSVDVDAGATLRFGPGARLRTKFLRVEGALDLGGAGRLEVLGSDDALQFGRTSSVSSGAPHEHRVVFEPLATELDFFDIVIGSFAAQALAFDVVDVSSKRLVLSSGSVTIRELTLAAGTTADVDPEASLVVAGCSGPGTAPVCPGP